jgi:hypothetical protein
MKLRDHFLSPLDLAAVVTAGIACLAYVGSLGCTGGSSSSQTADVDGGVRSETGGASGPADSSLEIDSSVAEAASAEADGAEPSEDAGVVDASMSTTPPSDAGAESDTGGSAFSEGGSAACASLFCEDFESGQIDTVKWAVQTSGGNMATVQQTKVAHGKYAAQLHAPASSKGYDFLITKAPAQLLVHHFGRAYMLVDPKLPVGHTGLMFAGSSGFPRLKYLEVASVRGGWQLSFVQLVGAPTGEADDHVDCAGNASCVPAIQMPVGVWICVEWEFNDQPDQVGLTVDGKPITTYSPIPYNNETSGLVGGFTDFGLGFYDWHPDNFAFDVYYDDLALDIKPVGCL